MYVIEGVPTSDHIIFQILLNKHFIMERHHFEQMPLPNLDFCRIQFDHPR